MNNIINLINLLINKILKFIQESNKKNKYQKEENANTRVAESKQKFLFCLRETKKSINFFKLFKDKFCCCCFCFYINK